MKGMQLNISKQKINLGHESTRYFYANIHSLHTPIITRRTRSRCMEHPKSTFHNNNIFTKSLRSSSLPITAASSINSATTSKPQVVLTREQGKNGKLQKMLENRGITCLEMPLIETAQGPDRAKLPDALQHQQFDWICITSPEAASVFVEGWKEAGKPQVRIAVVGEGTGKILTAFNEDTLIPQFIPSVANAEHFGPELPFLPNGTNRVLYPASNKASSVLQEGLLARGFDVVRLNTYDTVPVQSLHDDVLDAAKKASVVAIASPSAVRAWVGFAGIDTAMSIAVAAIGSTSARAAEKVGLKKIHYPEKPGLDTFAEVIVNALEQEERQ